MKKKRFRLYVPVDCVIENPKDARRLWEDLKTAGGASYSSDGWSYEIRTERVTLSSIRAMCAESKPNE